MRCGRRGQRCSLFNKGVQVFVEQQGCEVEIAVDGRIVLCGHALAVGTALLTTIGHIASQMAVELRSTIGVALLVMLVVNQTVSAIGLGIMEEAFAQLSTIGHSQVAQCGEFDIIERCPISSIFS